METKYDHAIDLSGLRCPLPVLRTKKALSQLPSGAVLKVRATDSDSESDIPAFVKQAGHQILAQEKISGGSGEKNGSDDSSGMNFYIQKR